ncbi:histone deacetylase 6-like [Babylonia areolata]|uniref:histone deacetylase 6-like n=1 Tax=Babylonia areolata TaxID=304850 RepID=UPI003FD0DA6D
MLMRLRRKTSTFQSYLFKVFCSRYVNEHMLFHSVAEEHLMVLSYSDLSVWCYACNDYIDNEATFPMKNAAHCHKFGEALPGAAPSQ